MKAIFDAIRAAKDLRKSDEGYHLQAFELRNRGHQNQLDDLALELMTKPLYHFTPWVPFALEWTPCRTACGRCCKA